GEGRQGTREVGEGAGEEEAQGQGWGQEGRGAQARGEEGRGEEGGRHGRAAGGREEGRREGGRRIRALAARRARAPVPRPACEEAHGHDGPAQGGRLPAPARRDRGREGAAVVRVLPAAGRHRLLRGRAQDGREEAPGRDA